MLENEDNHVMVYVCIRRRLLDLPCAMVLRLVWRLVWRIYNETYHDVRLVANITLVHSNCTLSWIKFDLQHNLL